MRRPSPGNEPSEQRRCLAEAKGAGLRWGHQLRKQAKRAAERAEPLRERFEQLAGPERERIEAELPKAKHRVAKLDGQDKARRRFERDHPEALRRLERLDERIEKAAYELDVERQALDGITAEHPQLKRSRAQQRARGLERGLDLGR